MRLDWQCPTCYAELGDKSHAAVTVCPYCGSLLVVDPGKRKFYLVKRGKEWHYFTKVPLKGNDGYLRAGGMEMFFAFRNGRWIFILEEKSYYLSPCSQRGDVVKIMEGEVEHLWGDIPIHALPEMRIQLLKMDNNILIRTSRSEICFSSDDSPQQ